MQHKSGLSMFKNNILYRYLLKSVHTYTCNFDIGTTKW